MRRERPQIRIQIRQLRRSTIRARQKIRHSLLPQVTSKMLLRTDLLQTCTHIRSQFPLSKPRGHLLELFPAVMGTGAAYRGALSAVPGRPPPQAHLPQVRAGSRTDSLCHWQYFSNRKGNPLSELTFAVRQLTPAA